MEEQKLLDQYNTYVSLLERVFTKDAVKKLTDALGERILFCPTGLTSPDGGYPGALVEFALQVAQKSKEYSLSQDTVRSSVRVALVHELGRIGDLTAELYVSQESDWHREKLGQNYKYNEDCSRMNIAHRSLFFLQHFGFDLSQEEWLSIATSQGLHLPENAFYGSTASNLSALLQFARSVVLNERHT
jgi:hypothetical protein